MQILADWPVTPFQLNFVGASFCGFPVVGSHPLMVHTYVHVFLSTLLKSEQESGIIGEPTFIIEVMVRSYRIHQNIQMAEGNEELCYQKESFNGFDPLTVAVVKHGTAVGHFPR